MLHTWGVHTLRTRRLAHKHIEPGSSRSLQITTRTLIRLRHTAAENIVHVFRYIQCVRALLDHIQNVRTQRRELQTASRYAAAGVQRAVQQA